jgi:thioredoxin-dependent peroxiredoxin
MEILLFALFVAIAFIVIVSIAQRSEPLSAGKDAPHFTLPDQHGNSVGFPNKNQKTIIAFFPRDNTSRCETEVQDFMHLKHDFVALGWQVLLVAIGKSADNQAYAARHEFDLTLLADEKGVVSRAYGSIIDFGFYRFAKRTTYAITADGKVNATYIVTEPIGHVEQVLKEQRQHL